MNKKILTGSECRNQLAEGIRKLYDAVVSTLGPGGRTVIIEDQFGGPPIITKDGVTVAKNINFENQYENLGVELVKQVASKTEELVGDGTTTATVLAYNIYLSCINYLKDNPVNIRNFRDSLINTSKIIVDKIDRDTIKDITSRDIYCISMISSNGDTEVAKLITDAFDSVGKDGSINVDRSESVDTELKLSPGMEFTCGYCNPNFVNTKTGVCLLNNCLVLLSSVPLVYQEDIIDAMKIAKSKNKSLLVIAPRIVGEALAILMSNKLQGKLESCAVNLPQFKNVNDSLNDLATITGAKILSQSISLTQDALEYFGEVKSVNISHNLMTITESLVSKEKIDEYIKMLRTQVMPNLKKYEIPGFENRLAKLSAGVATIFVGGRTEADYSERRDRVDDAVLAVRSACDGGTVIGGGRELYQISEELDESDPIQLILKDALKSPYRAIMSNYYLDPNEYTFELNQGMDLVTGNIGDLRILGILDPAKVTKSAFMNAISIVNMLLSTNVVITNIGVKKTPLTDKMYDL